MPDVVQQTTERIATVEVSKLLEWVRTMLTFFGKVDDRTMFRVAAVRGHELPLESMLRNPRLRHLVHDVNEV